MKLPARLIPIAAAAGIAHAGNSVMRRQKIGIELPPPPIPYAVTMEGAGTGGSLAYSLYLFDNSSLTSDAPPPVLARSMIVEIPSGLCSQLVIAEPDQSVKLSGKAISEMGDPTMFLAFDVTKSSMSYVTGPNL